MNNPPAFPRSFSNETLASNGTTQRGMTLRDYFAAAALTGMIAGTANPAAMGYPKDNEAGEKAYIYADAMLKAREQ